MTTFEPFSNGEDSHGREMRYAVRALLFNPNNELLLINYAPNPSIHLLGQEPVLRDNWGTAGGGIDRGEDLEKALRREIFEEIGHTDVTIGPCVWHRRADLLFLGRDVRLDERYFIAHTREDTFDTSAHTETERKYVLGMKWWNVSDIAHSDAVILPLFLRDKIGALAAGIYPPATEIFDECLKIDAEHVV